MKCVRHLFLRWSFLEFKYVKHDQRCQTSPRWFWHLCQISFWPRSETIRNVYYTLCFSARSFETKWYRQIIGHIFFLRQFLLLETNITNMVTFWMGSSDDSKKTIQLFRSIPHLAAIHRAPLLNGLDVSNLFETRSLQQPFKPTR